MLLNLFDFLGRIIDLLGSLCGFLLKAAASLFSGLASVFLAPFRLGAKAVHGLFDVSFGWLPLFILAAAALTLLVLALAGCAIAANAKRK